MGINYGDDVGAGDDSVVEPVGAIGEGPTVEPGVPVEGVVGSTVEAGATLVVSGVVSEAGVVVPEVLTSAGSEPRGSIA